MPRGALRDPPGGRPKGRKDSKPRSFVILQRRALRAEAQKYGLLAIERLASILIRAEEAERNKRKADGRPKDSDAMSAAAHYHGFGKPMPEAPLHGMIGTYDFAKLAPEQMNQLTAVHVESMEDGERQVQIGEDVVKSTTGRGDD